MSGGELLSRAYGECDPTDLAVDDLSSIDGESDCSGSTGSSRREELLLPTSRRNNTVKAPSNLDEGPNSKVLPSSWSASGPSERCSSILFKAYVCGTDDPTQISGEEPQDLQPLDISLARRAHGGERWQREDACRHLRDRFCTGDLGTGGSGGRKYAQSVKHHLPYRKELPRRSCDGHTELMNDLSIIGGGQSRYRSSICGTRSSLRQGKGAGYDRFCFQIDLREGCTVCMAGKVVTTTLAGKVVTARACHVKTCRQ